MVSVEDSCRKQVLQGTPAVSPAAAKVHRKLGRSMRTVRSNLSHAVMTVEKWTETTLSDSLVDFRLLQLAAADADHDGSRKSRLSAADLLDVSQTFTDFSICSSDISGELERLASLPSAGYDHCRSLDQPLGLGLGLGLGLVQCDESEMLRSMSLEDLQQKAQTCVEALRSPYSGDQRSAAERLRLLAKNRMENRAVIGASGAISALVPLLRSSEPSTQEHVVTALLNLSLFEPNKRLITDAGAIKPLIYALKTGTSASKQNAACALLNLSMIDDNRLTIGACGAIPPLVAMLMGTSTRGKKDAMTTLYKLCGASQNKERAVRAGVVGPLVTMVGERGGGIAEKAMVLLNVLSGIPAGKTAIVQEGGIHALVEAIEDGSTKGKEFAVSTLLQLCGERGENRGLLVREGAIPPLVALSQSGIARANYKAEILLKLLREHRQDMFALSP